METLRREPFTLDDRIGQSESKLEELPALAQLMNLTKLPPVKATSRRLTSAKSAVSKEEAYHGLGFELTSDSITLNQTTDRSPTQDPFLSAVSFDTQESVERKTRKTRNQAGESWTYFAEQDMPALSSLKNTYTGSGMTDQNVAMVYPENEARRLKGSFKDNEYVLPAIDRKGSRQSSVSKDTGRYLSTTGTKGHGSFASLQQADLKQEKPSKRAATFKQGGPAQMLKQANVKSKKLEAIEPGRQPSIPMFHKDLKLVKKQPAKRYEDTSADFIDLDSMLEANGLTEMQSTPKPAQPKVVNPKPWQRPQRVLQLSVIMEQEEKASIEHSTSALNQMSMSKVTTPKQSTALIKSEVRVSTLFAKRLTVEDIHAGAEPPNTNTAQEKRLHSKTPDRLHSNAEAIERLIDAAEVFQAKPLTQQTRLEFAKAVADFGLLPEVSLEALKTFVLMSQVQIAVQGEYLLNPKTRTYYLVLAGEVRLDYGAYARTGQTFVMDVPGAKKVKKETAVYELETNGNEGSLKDNHSEVDWEDFFTFKTRTALLLFDAQDLRRIRTLCLRAGQSADFAALIRPFKDTLEDDLWTEMAQSVAT